MNELSFQMKNTRDEEALARQGDLPAPVIIDGDTDPEELGQDHGALQGLSDNDHPQYFHKATETSNNVPEGTTNKYLTSTQKGHLTGDGDGDAEHKHDSKMDKAITALDEKATPHDDDVLVLSDSEASGALKKVKVSNIGGSGGASAFTALTDSPAAYTDQGGKVVAVKAAEDGLEFIDPPEGGSGGGGDAATFWALQESDVPLTETLPSNASSSGTYTQQDADIIPTTPITLSTVRWNGCYTTDTYELFIDSVSQGSKVVTGSTEGEWILSEPLEMAKDVAVEFKIIGTSSQRFKYRNDTDGPAPYESGILLHGDWKAAGGTNFVPFEFVFMGVELTEITVGGAVLAGNIRGAYDIEGTEYPDAGMSDEFNEETLDAQWTCVGGASGTINPNEAAPSDSKYDLTSRAGAMLVQLKSLDEIGFRIDDMLADGEQLVMSLGLANPGDGEGPSNNTLWAGLSTNDDDAGPRAGSYRGFFWDGANDDRIIVYNGSTSAEMAVGLSIGRTYWRIARVGDNLYYSWSPDGVAWASLKSAALGTHDNLWIFFRSAAAFDHAPVFSVNWFRHVANTNLDPWPAPSLTVAPAGDFSVIPLALTSGMFSGSGLLNMDELCNGSAHDSDDYGGWDGGTSLTCDLGAEYLLAEIRAIPYHFDGRSYKDIKLEVSTDDISYTTIYDISGDSMATAEGYRSVFPEGIPARYVRIYQNGSTVNSANHLTELIISQRI